MNYKNIRVIEVDESFFYYKSYEMSTSFTNSEWDFFNHSFLCYNSTFISLKQLKSGVLV